MAYVSLSRDPKARLPESLADVRGFEVRTRDDDDKVGKVSDFLVSDDGRIRYLDVDLGGIFNRRHVVLPIGAAQVDRANDVVWITGMTKDQIEALPDYDGDPRTITDEYETRVRGAAGPGRAQDAALYDQGRFYAERGGADAAREARLVLSEEQIKVGTRRVEAGEAAIRKTVETEHVRDTVPVQREEVVVERRPLSADANANVEIGEDEIRIPLTREEAVVEKRAVPVEEVVVKKRVVTDEQPVEADVRRERLVDEGTTDARGAARRPDDSNRERRR